MFFFNMKSEANQNTKFVEMNAKFDVAIRCHEYRKRTSFTDSFSYRAVAPYCNVFWLTCIFSNEINILTFHLPKCKLTPLTFLPT